MRTSREEETEPRGPRQVDLPDAGRPQLDLDHAARHGEGGKVGVLAGWVERRGKEAVLPIGKRQRGGTGKGRQVYLDHVAGPGPIARAKVGIRSKRPLV